MTTSPRRATTAARRGTTTVEFALTAPILFLLIMAGIEFSRACVLINSAKVAASEGARCGIVMGTTEKDIEAVVRKELSMVGIAHADVLVDPAVVTDETELVTVGVSVPLDHRNGYVIPKFFMGEHVFKITSIPREAKNDAQMSEHLAAAFNSMEQKLKSAASSSSGKTPGGKPGDKGKGQGKGEGKGQGKSEGKGQGKSEGKGQGKENGKSKGKGKGGGEDDDD